MGLGPSAIIAYRSIVNGEVPVKNLARPVPAMKWTGIWRPARAESPKQQSRLVRGNRIENGVGSEVY